MKNAIYHYYKCFFFVQLELFRNQEKAMLQNKIK